MHSLSGVNQSRKTLLSRFVRHTFKTGNIIINSEPMQTLQATGCFSKRQRVELFYEVLLSLKLNNLIRDA